VWHLPRGFPTPCVPPGNPMSDAKVALGKRLFFEQRLSVTGKYSCASCHDPARSFTDGRPVAIGATGAALPHSAMALINVAYNVSFGWTEPQLSSLESQMLEPLLNRHPVELGMAGRRPAVARRLAADASYRTAFTAVFRDAGPPVTFDHIVKAIAAFERTLISGNSSFDRYVFGGQHDALSPEAKQGMALFFSPRAGCSACHSGFNFSGNWRDSEGPTGAASFADNGASELPMRVPTLRNIALTAPYMHDGRFPTLEAVVDHYAQVAEKARSEPAARSGTAIDPRLRTFDLTQTERTQLIAFLNSLTDASFVAANSGAAAAGARRGADASARVLDAAAQRGR
jgi:cytochrome c peroxidase